jgi:hypothetical protein
MFDLAKAFLDLFHVINPQVFITSALLFFIGYVIAPTAYFKKIKWLTIYPFYIIKLMDAFFQKKHHPVKIFFILLSLNSISLFINLLSAWGGILPIAVIVYMGINIGVVMYHTLEGKFYYIGLINPVALLELPAAWLSITMAIQFSLQYYFGVSFLPEITFGQYVNFFIKTIFPILVLAGIIETFMIAKSEKDKNSTP